MDEDEPEPKQLGSAEAVVKEGPESETESEAEVPTMTVMGETGSIDIAESLPNTDDPETAFAGWCSERELIHMSQEQNHDTTGFV